MAIIARIKLAQGETGYYDEKTGIYLNWRNPIADVKLGSDLSGLRRSVKHRRIHVIEGTLGTQKTFKQILLEKKAARTGIPLEKLMGHTPLAVEPTEADALDKKAEAPKTEPAAEPAAPAADPVAENKAAAPANEKAKAAMEALAADAVEEDGADETVADMTVKPGSIKKLKVGATREITSSVEIASAESSDEAIATVTFEGTKATVTGVAAGDAVITLKSAAGGEGVVETKVVK